MNVPLTIAAPSVKHAAVDASFMIEKLRINHLSFYYENNQALKDICLTLYANKSPIIGPSGCGKSTLLRVLNRLYGLYPDQRAEGEVLLDGIDILRHRSGPELTAIQDRHGLSGIDCISNVDL